MAKGGKEKRRLNPYEVLGLSPSCSEKEIKTAFRRLAREHHPDVVDDDSANGKFVEIREAYEILIDPKKRSRFDSRFERGARSHGNTGFSERFQGPHVSARGARFAESLNLDDIFRDTSPDFGFGNSTTGGGANKPNPRVGRDVHVRAPVPVQVLKRGGTVEVEFDRARRDDAGGIQMVHEYFDLRVIPGQNHGDAIRVSGMGHCGENGGGYGDLVCDLVMDSSGSRSAGERRKPKTGQKGNTASVEIELPISIQESLLGARVNVSTPGGDVMITLPSCIAGGSRLRLRGKGEKGAGGARGDVVVRIKIAPPPILDDASRALIERFASINKYNPRS